MFNYDQAVNYILLAGMMCLSITIIFCLYFAIKGPKQTDRMIATNMISAKAVIIIVMVSYYSGEEYLLDVALAYALLSFLASIVFARLFLGNKLKAPVPDKRGQPEE